MVPLSLVPAMNFVAYGQLFIKLDNFEIMGTSGT